MSNTELNAVDRDSLLQLARDLNLTVVEQSAYYRCSWDGSPARIYVAKTQKVTRVDFADFCPEADGVKTISAEEAKEQRLGKVRGQLDFTRDNDTVLAAFAAACQQLKDVPPKSTEKKARKAKAPAVVDVDSLVAAQAASDDSENNAEVE